jgi:hypothetical protein
MRSEEEIRKQIEEINKNIVCLGDDTQFLMHHGWFCALNWVLENNGKDKI